METQLKAIEVEENDIIKVDNFDLEKAIEFAEKKLILLERVIKIAIKRTNENDWHDIGGRPYLGTSGCKKMMPLFGIKVKDIKSEKIISEDSEGQFYIYKYTGTFSWQGGEIQVSGARSQRDAFWAIKNGELKDSSQIDERDIMVAAQTNMFGLGLRSLLGLENLTWDQLEEYKIYPKNKVEFKGQKKEAVSETDKKLQESITEKLVEMAGGDIEKAGKTLQEISTFQADGKTIPGFKSASELTGRRLAVNAEKVEKMYQQFKKGQA